MRVRVGFVDGVVLCVGMIWIQIHVIDGVKRACFLRSWGTGRGWQKGRTGGIFYSDGVVGSSGTFFFWTNVDDTHGVVGVIVFGFYSPLCTKFYLESLYLLGDMDEDAMEQQSYAYINTSLGCGVFSLFFWLSRSSLVFQTAFLDFIY